MTSSATWSSFQLCYFFITLHRLCSCKPAFLYASLHHSAKITLNVHSNDNASKKKTWHALLKQLVVTNTCLEEARVSNVLRLYYQPASPTFYWAPGDHYQQEWVVSYIDSTGITTSYCLNPWFVLFSTYSNVSCCNVPFLLVFSTKVPPWQQARYNNNSTMRKQFITKAS